MIFVIDVGNTNIVMGIYKENKLIYKWRMATIRERASDEYGMFFISMFNNANIRFNQVKGIIISSVVPPVMYSLEHSIQKYFHIKPIIIGPGIKTGLNLKVDVPKQVGADRIVNAVGAFHKHGGPIIIIDFGTATTLCAVSSKSEYLGGTIFPGVKVSADALFQKASKLPKIELAEPKKVIGKNTINAMQSGIVYGHAGSVDMLVQRIKEELLQYEGGNCNVKVTATGGLARLISGVSSHIDYIDPNLTLEGLKILYYKNNE